MHVRQSSARSTAILNGWRWISFYAIVNPRERWLVSRQDPLLPIPPMDKKTIDILMITYNRPEYTRLALTRLLETCDDGMRVWLWHNGIDQATLSIVQELSSSPRVHRFHHSAENKKLREPTNWAWTSSAGDFVCKVDDDCLMPYGWADRLRQAHADVPEFGIIGCWRFPDEDFAPEYAQRKIETF